VRPKEPIRTLRKLGSKTESWSPLAPGQIIAQPKLRPIVSQEGYYTDGVKTSAVWTNGREACGSFYLIDAVSGGIVYEGELRPWGYHIWGGYNLIADFSSFRKEGCYKLRVRIRGVEAEDSHPFEISSSVYQDWAGMAARWFYYQRCGCEVPGWHGPCHLDDALLDGRQVDATGGWHDAGDYNKWTGCGAYGILSLVALYEALPDRRLVDEAIWEADYVCKVQRSDGTFWSVTGPGEDPWRWRGRPEEEPQRVLRETPGLGGTLLLGASLARLARSVGEERKERYMRTALRAYRLAGRPGDMDIGTEAAALLAELALFRLTGDGRYAEAARGRVRELLRRQDGEGFFWKDEGRTSPEYGAGWHLVALYEFLKALPGDELGEEVLRAFGRWAAWGEELTRLSPFGQMGTVVGGELRNLPPASGNIHLASAAAGMAMAGVLLGERRYLELAERQLQWIAGFNPTERSTFVGVGVGPGVYHHRYVTCEGHEDGAVPGGVLNGIVGSDGGRMELGDMGTGDYVVADGLPVDYPILDTDEEARNGPPMPWKGYTPAHHTNEYWTLNNGWFILGALYLSVGYMRYDTHE